MDTGALGNQRLPIDATCDGLLERLARRLQFKTRLG